ncbi:MAG: adenylate/guanylate cyclase domain-containing protein [Mycobacterium sp.]|nr:adenylate/guanylate cyclase domain-containing protein [Mycobacterium sp.]
MTFDVESSGLLDGLDGDAREERAELISWLVQQGFGVEEIRSSFSPMLLPARRILGDDGNYVSTRQTSEQTGLDVDQLIRFQRAAGMPTVDDLDAPVFMQRDADTAVHVKRFLDLGIDPDLMLNIVRVLAQGLANACEVMNVATLAAVLQPGASELDIAKGTDALVGAAAPMLGPMINDLLFLQLRRILETEAVNAGERAAGTPRPEAKMIGASFADLVGFTVLGEELAPEQLEELANRLAQLAHDVAQPPVRFIKTIGDAVMFVSQDTASLLDAVLALVEAAAADETLPRLRVGVAYGAAVSRAGDWFGSPVNLASRVTSAARPGAVLVSESARQQVGDDERFRWSFAGPRRLKGFRDEIKLYRLRRAQEPATG